MALEVVALSIIDRLIQLLTLRERNRERTFTNFIEPLFKDAELVTRDYLALLAELVHKVEKQPLVDVIVWLEERRTAYQTVRIKLRKELENPVYKELSFAKEPTPLQRFTFGVWSLVRGGTALSASSEDEFRGGILMGEYGYEGHTVLVLLERIREAMGDQLSPQKTEDILRTIAKQQLAIERAWQDVVQGHIDLKHEHL